MEVFLLFLVITSVAACPESCKCKNGVVKCELPEARDFPPLKWPNNMTTLDLSGNNILNIATNTTQNLQNLKELILDGNKIYFLENGAFQGIPNLKKLAIQSNNLHFIEEDVFADLLQLEELYLAENFISNFPNLQNNANLKKLCIANNQLEEIPENAMKNLSNLSVLKLKNNKLTSLPRQVFSDDVKRSLIELNLVGNNFRDIPEIIKETENLEKLSLCNNPLKVFQAGDFSGFRKLKSLSMTNIGVREIIPNLFSDQSALEELYLGKNKIKGDTLSNLKLPKLKKLILSRNLIPSLPGNAFTLLRHLEELDLSNCQISNIDQLSLKFLSELKILKLSNNLLTDIPDLEYSTDLEKLDLSNNNLNNITLDAFRTLRLKKLLLSNNSLIYFDGNITDADFSRLESVDLSYNQFEDFPSVVATSMYNLLSLNMSFNKLDNVESWWFKDLPKLQTLNLKGNNLTHINETSFGSLTNLKQLYLCKNQLKKLEGSALSGLPLLEELTADKNKLVEIEENTFSNNINLKKISLSFNDLKYVSKKAFFELKKLRELWLLYNHLTEPPKLGRNLNLRILGLCGNPLHILPHSSLKGPKDIEVLLLKDAGLTSFSAGILQFPEKLKYLKLAENNLTAIPATIKEMKSLEKLVLSGNPIETLCWSNFVGLNNLKTIYMDGMRLHTFDFTTLFQISPALRSLKVSSNSWKCGCEMEMFALGIDGKRADIVIEDRDSITCAAPDRYKGKRIDYLRLGDFKHCQGSSVKEITQTSATLTLPNIKPLALDHPSVQHHISYRPLNGGREKNLVIESEQRDAVISGLTPHTTYMVCVKVVRPAMVRNLKEDDLDKPEKCHKVTTLARNHELNDSGKESNWLSKNMVILYSVLGGVVGLAFVVMAISVTVWCRRASMKKHSHFANISSASDEMKVCEAAPKIRNGQMNGDSKQNDMTLASNSNGCHVNEAYDAIKTRTKV